MVLLRPCYLFRWTNSWPSKSLSLHLHLYINRLLQMRAWLSVDRISEHFSWMGPVGAAPSWFATVGFSFWFGTIARHSHQGGGCFVCAHASWLWLRARGALSDFVTLFILGTKQMNMLSTKPAFALNTSEVRRHLALYHARAPALAYEHESVDTWTV